MVWQGKKNKPKKKKKRDQRSGNGWNRDTVQFQDHGDGPRSGLGSDSGSVILWLCGLGQVLSTLCASVSSSVKTHLLRRIIEEEIGKVGRSAGKCLIPGSLKRGVVVGWFVAFTRFHGVNIHVISDYKLSTGDQDVELGRDTWLAVTSWYKVASGAPVIVMQGFWSQAWVISPDTECTKGCTGLSSHTQSLESRGFVSIHSRKTMPCDGATTMSKWRQSLCPLRVHIATIKPHRPGTREALINACGINEWHRWSGL